MQIAVVVVQSLSRFWLFATLWMAAPQASLSVTISWSLLRFMAIELVYYLSLPLLQSKLGSTNTGKIV